MILEDKDILIEGTAETFCANGSILAGHPDLTIPGIVTESGSLGHGLGIAAGMALTGQKVVVLIGDGELYEGSTWEALLFIAHHKLPVTLIIDRNQQIVCDFTEDVNGLESIRNKLVAFGWYSIEIDGHNLTEIEWTLKNYRCSPLAIIANTVKGKGVSFMERSLRWHHSIPTKEEYELAKKELDG